jgi:hypothetical protein
MLIEETHLNATEGYRMGEETIDVADTIFGEDPAPGDIYRWCLKEFGRCTGKVYVGNAVPRHVGWVFVKRDRYEDTGEIFLHETWVTLLDRDETVRERDYHEISEGGRRR